MTISVVEIEVPGALNVTATEDTLTVDLADGRTISTPLVWYPRLVHATPQERSNWKLHAAGQHIHWPDLDEDLSVEGLLAGRKSGEGRKSLERWLEARESGHSVAIHDIATQDFTRSNEINPNAAQSYIMRAVAFQLQGEYNSALQDYTRAIELEPSSASAYHSRGTTYWYQGNYDRATQDFKKALALDPSMSIAYLSRGLSYLVAEDLFNAMLDLNVAQNSGFDIASEFKGLFGSVEDFERNHNVQLPDHIKAMLTPKQ